MVIHQQILYLSVTHSTVWTVVPEVWELI